MSIVNESGNTKIGGEYTSPVFVTPVLGTPASGDLSNTTGYPASELTGLGTNVEAWLITPSSANLDAAVTDDTGSGALVFANTPTLVAPLLGTPTSGVLTNCTGTPVAGLAAGTSAELKTVISDETGSGALVFADTPTLVTPVLGTPTSGTLTNCTGFPAANLAGLGANVATFLATPSSTNLAAAVTGEVGEGAVVFAHVRHLGSQYTNTGTTGTEVTGLSATLTAGSYTFKYWLVCQGTGGSPGGIELGINYTGTATRLVVISRYVTTGLVSSAADSGIADNVAATAQLVEGNAAIAETTTGPNMHTTGFVTSGSDTLIIVEGVVVVSNGGDLELWASTDASGDDISIEVGSSVFILKVA